MEFLLKTILLLINLVAGYYFIFANPLKFSVQTSTKITLNVRPIVFLWTGIFVSQLFVLLLFATISLTRITQLICNRLPNNISISNIDLSAKKNTLTVRCNLTSNYWFGYKKSELQVSELLEAKLENEVEIASQNKPKYTYKILLITPRDSFTFTHITHHKK